ncbi:metal-sensitive transcriptional regulator [Paenalkalicoccus suaedae]|uniref:Metal-sensitive transcriptional regulator n=1 Tax=Paenalkalicoccus suaedae TaxID=2592382 RepID=A0A859FEI7_9BACI|nr:metal-sensitive transcriptional regulator [Paenalkalicoccus suaedae]QKS71341.1 metal-sensitive transcriptional regulator [Paenalkalicoccus suaedae]
MKDTEHKVHPRSEEEKAALLRRLKRVEGQIRGIQQMVIDDRYCMDVLVQLRAAEAGLKKVGLEVVEEHTKGCMMHAMEKGNDEKVVEELMTIIHQYAK